MKDSPLLQLMAYFGALSLVTFGGVSASLPDIHRFIVDQHHWMASDEFTRVFGISNAAPGPNMMFVGMLGYNIAGPLGAVACFVATALPSSVLAYFGGGFWDRLRDRPWRAHVQAGLVPVTVGLLLASGAILSFAADIGSWVALAVTVVTVVVTRFTRIHPLWCLGLGALLGGFGWV